MTQGAERNHHYAGFWLRMGAVVLDTIILWIPCSLFRWFFSDAFSAPLFEVLDFFQLTVIWAGYYGLTESSTWQATIGKRLVGLQVIDLNGGRLSFARAVARFLASFLAAIPLGLGLAMIAWTARKQGFHDMIVRCLVIRTPEASSVAA